MAKYKKCTNMKLARSKYDAKNPAPPYRLSPRLALIFAGERLIKSSKLWSFSVRKRSECALKTPRLSFAKNFSSGNKCRGDAACQTLSVKRRGFSLAAKARGIDAPFFVGVQQNQVGVVAGRDQAFF